MKLRCIPITAVLLTTIFVCLGCDRSPPLPPLRIVTFITKWPIIPPGQWRQLRQDLDNGNRTLSDVQFGRLTCEFVNDTAASGRVSVNLNGMPGDPNLNFTFVSVGLHRAQNLGNCIPGTNEIPTEILIQTDRGIVVGQVNKGGNMEVAFGNDRFTADYREFTLTNVDVARHEVTVRFQMMATNHANNQDTRVLMVVDGSVVTPF